MKVKDWFADFVRGAVLGSGILPGVSVGTMAVILGFYNRLLDTINDLKHNFGKAFLRLLPIALGCILAAVGLLFAYAKTKDYILFEIVCLFAGCIIGGLPIVFNKLKGEKIKPLGYVRMGAALIVAAGIGVFSALFHLDASAAFHDPNANAWVYPVAFGAGFIAAVACLIPGISGSMVLFIFGLYDPIVGLYIGESSIIHNSSILWPGLGLTALILLGVLIGILAVSKVMAKLLKEHERGTYEVVLGFILGSLVSMFINNSVYPAYPNFKFYDYIIGAVLLLGAAALLFFLVKRGEKNNLCLTK